MHITYSRWRRATCSAGIRYRCDAIVHGSQMTRSDPSQRSTEFSQQTAILSPFLHGWEESNLRMGRRRGGGKVFVSAGTFPKFVTPVLGTVPPQGAVGGVEGYGQPIRQNKF